VGIVMLIERDEASFQATTGQSADELLVIGLVQFVIAFLLFVVASSLLWGAPWARLVVAIVLGLQLVVSTYALIAHEGGGLQWNAIIQAGFALFILWVLYGNAQAQEYFASYES
jgi:hypothetical protein